MKAGFAGVIKEFFFPRGRRCALCGRDVCGGAKCVCAKCVGKLPMNLRERKLGDVKVRAPFEYRGEARKLMLTFKLRGGKYLARFFALHMAECARDYPLEAPLIPVPPHENTLKERGYCQTLALCQELERETGRETMQGVLARARPSARQSSLGRAQRLENAFCAFKCDRAAPECVILVDDIVTTGATVLDCVRALKNAGAKRVYVLAAAVANGRNRL